MANRYWVGGTGSWSDAANHWSDASGGTPGAGNLPTSSDDAIFDANSASGAYIVTVNGSPTVVNLTYTGLANKTDRLLLSGSLTVTGILTVNGNSATNRVLIRSSVLGTARTITAATVSISNADFQDITGAGTGSWNLSAVSSGDCGGNSNITFTVAADQHWTNVNGGDWSDSANWTSRVPLPQDNVLMDCAFGTSKTVIIDMPRAGKNIDWTGATWTTSLTWQTSSCTIFGGIKLINGLTTTVTSTIITLSGRASYNIDTLGVSVVFAFTVAAPSGTYTLQNDFVSTGSNGIQVSNGTFDCNNKNITAASFGSNYPYTRSIIMASGTITLTSSSNGWSINDLTGLTFDAGTSTIKYTNTNNNNMTFTGGGLTYNNVWFSRGASTGNITIVDSNTFNDFKDDGTAAHSLLFTAGTTQTVTTFTVSGTAGNLITINSTTTATHALTKTGGGTISCDYLNIQHSVATPSNTWHAGKNSVNNQAIATAGSGWIFPNNFFLLF